MQGQLDLAALDVVTTLGEDQLSYPPSPPSNDHTLDKAIASDKAGQANNFKQESKQESVAQERRSSSDRLRDGFNVVGGQLSSMVHTFAKTQQSNLRSAPQLAQTRLKGLFQRSSPAQTPRAHKSPLEQSRLPKDRNKHMVEGNTQASLEGNTADQRTVEGPESSLPSRLEPNNGATG